MRRQAAAREQLERLRVDGDGIDARRRFFLPAFGYADLGSIVEVGLQGVLSGHYRAGRELTEAGVAADQCHAAVAVRGGRVQACQFGQLAAASDENLRHDPRLPASVVPEPTRTSQRLAGRVPGSAGHRGFPLHM
ncbi:hypothetical protein Plo01_45710 [Planobispora longispora]|uniref:Uncharacterized protein n=1 Tax=Planobispora longispora TaxID=28887 RepID=A0A8J3RM06_9ACTN|nr:hypothetical protein Plo01_45710 [Planobispora longispora]